jgi:acyl carrier protein
MSVERKIKEIISDILEVLEDDIHPDFGPEDTPLWDSLNNLRLITALETEFDVRLTMDEIRAIGSFDKICTVIRAHIEAGK